LKLRPSPFVQQFVQSFKPSLNDSLEKLQREFMLGYQEAMGMSDVKDVRQMTIKEENEQLQQQVSQMKVDIEALVGKGWQSA
jgi:hypothetical protein